MKKIVCKDYEEMSAMAADVIAFQIKSKPDSVIGFATGSTPVGAYKRLVEMDLDFSRITSFNLDEYYPLERDNPQSYYRFMHDNLFGLVNIPDGNINIPDGECENPIAECEDYDKKLIKIGGTDLQILGIGNNGHIAFIEPNDDLPLATGVFELDDDTIAANSRFFENAGDVPKKALSMGLRGIFNSRHILLLISGKAKANAVKRLLDETVSTQAPASLLKLHPKVTVIMTEDTQ